MAMPSFLISQKQKYGLLQALLVFELAMLRSF
jgi:hypothetical protein